MPSVAPSTAKKAPLRFEVVLAWDGDKRRVTVEDTMDVAGWVHHITSGAKCLVVDSISGNDSPDPLRGKFYDAGPRYNHKASLTAYSLVSRGLNVPMADCLRDFEADINVLGGDIVWLDEEPDLSTLTTNVEMKFTIQKFLNDQMEVVLTGDTAFLRWNLKFSPTLVGYVFKDKPPRWVCEWSVLSKPSWDYDKSPAAAIHAIETTILGKSYRYRRSITWKYEVKDHNGVVTDVALDPPRKNVERQDTDFGL